MLRWRLLASVVLISFFLLAFYLDAKAGASAPLLLVIALMLSFVCVFELSQLLRRGLTDPNLPLTALCTAAVVTSSWFAPDIAATHRLAGIAVVGLAFVVAVLILALNKVIDYRPSMGNALSLSAEIFITAYVGVLLAVTAQLRWVAEADAGYLALGSLVVAVKSGDVGAYTLGRLLGRKKMSPRLSPGKTWAGFVGALVTSGLASVLWFQIATPLFDPAWQPPRWYWAALYGTTLGLIGLIGDLVESMIKRDAGAKDSGEWLPGFGGMLDLLDSILYAGPVAYILWLVLPLKTW